MKPFRFIVLLLFICSTKSFSQSYNWAWAKSAGGYNSDQVYAITTDLQGNIYETGMFQSPQIDFDGITLLNSAGALGTGDLFIVKYDPSNHALWAKSCGGVNNDYGKSITTDLNGNIYITGNFASDSLHFGDSVLVNTVTGLPDMMVLKYDEAGNEIWAFNAKGFAISEGISLDIDALGNGYVTGQFSGNIVLGDSMLINQGMYDVFIARFNDDGQVLWAKSYGDNFTDFPYGLCVDQSNNIYITGTFNSGQIIFGNYTLFDVGDYDIFITKFDSLGNVVWAISEGDIGEDAGKGIASDRNGNVYVTGAFESPSITFGPSTFNNAGSGFDAFVAKYNSNGILQWAKHAGNAGFFDWGYNLQCNLSGLYLCGLFTSDTIAFDNIILTNSGINGTTDLFLVKYDFNGNAVWALNTIGDQSEEGACVVIDINDNCYVGGAFASNTTYFGNISITNSTTTGNADLFLAKLAATSVVLNENIYNKNITLFPNPTNDYFVVSGKINSAENINEIKLFNTVGQEVLSQKLANSFSDARIDCKNLEPGIYEVLLLRDKVVYRGKIVII